MKIKLNIIMLVLLLALLSACNKEKEINNNVNDETKTKLILKAVEHHNNSNYFKVTGKGVIKASLITQNIKLEKEYDNGNMKYFNAAYGSKLGFKIDKYVLANGNMDNLSLYKGSVNKSLEIKEKDLNKDKKSEIDHNEFKQLYGVGINEFNYIINNKTIKEIYLDDDDYYNLKLDLKESVTNYITHIAEINPYKSNTDKTKFSYIKLKIKLNDNNKIEEIKYYENYEVSVKIINTYVTQKLEAEITESYSYERNN